MITKLFLFISFACFSASVFAESRDFYQFSELSTGVGCMDYRNTFAIPSGLPGTVFRLDYHTGKADSSQLYLPFEFFTRVDYARMIRSGLDTDLNFPYHHAELRTGFVFRKKLPVFIPHFSADAGLGLSLNMLVGYNPHFKNNLYYSMASLYGNWYLSPDIHLHCGYEYKKWRFRAGFYTPLLVAGFFPEFQNFPNSVYDVKTGVSYVLTPNTVSCIDRYTRIDGLLSASYRVKTTQKSQFNINISYSFERLHSLIHHYTEKKQKQILSVGFTFIRK